MPTFLLFFLLSSKEVLESNTETIAIEFYTQEELKNILGDVGEEVFVHRSLVFFGPQNIHLGFYIRNFHGRGMSSYGILFNVLRNEKNPSKSPINQTLYRVGVQSRDICCFVYLVTFTERVIDKNGRMTRDILGFRFIWLQMDYFIKQTV